MSIAKLYEIDGYDAVVLKTNDPAVDIHYEFDDFIANTKLDFPDTDEGFGLRDRAFDEISEDQVRNIRENIVQELFNV